jgi:hypothetical protein
MESRSIGAPSGDPKEPYGAQHTHWWNRVHGVSHLFAHQSLVFKLGHHQTEKALELARPLPDGAVKVGLIVDVNVHPTRQLPQNSDIQRP